MFASNINDDIYYGTNWKHQTLEKCKITFFFFFLSTRHLNLGTKAMNNSGINNCSRKTSLFTARWKSPIEVSSLINQIFIVIMNQVEYKAVSAQINAQIKE